MKGTQSNQEYYRPTHRERIKTERETYREELKVAGVQKNEENGRRKTSRCLAVGWRRSWLRLRSSERKEVKVNPRRKTPRSGRKKLLPRKKEFKRPALLWLISLDTTTEEGTPGARRREGARKRVAGKLVWSPEKK